MSKTISKCPKPEIQKMSKTSKNTQKKINPLHFISLQEQIASYFPVERIQKILPRLHFSALQKLVIYLIASYFPGDNTIFKSEQSNFIGGGRASFFSFLPSITLSPSLIFFTFPLSLLFLFFTIFHLCLSIFLAPATPKQFWTFLFFWTFFLSKMSKKCSFSKCPFGQNNVQKKRYAGGSD